MSRTKPAKTPRRGQTTAKPSPRAAKPSPRAAKPSPRAAKPSRPAKDDYAERFDRSPYEIPPLDLSEAIALGTALLAARPRRQPPAIDEEAARLTAARDRARGAVRADGTTVAARPFDVAMDRAWGTMVRRIQDVSELPAERFPEAVEASKVFGLVQDLSILKLNYLAEFAQIGARLDALKREGCLDAARRFAGPEFLDEVLRCHAAYGEALGVSDEAVRSEEGDTPRADRGAARLELAETIGEYAVQVLALARSGRPATWTIVQSALAPILELRARQAEQLRAEAPVRPPPVHPPL